MKKKITFVTNSSSCSFVGFGIRIDKNDKKSLDNIKKIIKERNIIIEDYEEDGDINDLLPYIIPEESKLSLCSGIIYDSEIFIGKEYVNMDENITKKEFHEQISEELKELGFEKRAYVIDEDWIDN